MDCFQAIFDICESSVHALDYFGNPEWVSEVSQSIYLQALKTTLMFLSWVPRFTGWVFLEPDNTQRSRLSSSTQDTKMTYC